MISWCFEKKNRWKFWVHFLLRSMRATLSSNCKPIKPEILIFSFGVQRQPHILQRSRVVRMNWWVLGMTVCQKYPLIFVIFNHVNKQDVLFAIMVSKIINDFFGYGGGLRFSNLTYVSGSSNFGCETILLAILAHILALKPIIFCNWFQKNCAK